MEKTKVSVEIRTRVPTRAALLQTASKENRASNLCRYFNVCAEADKKTGMRKKIMEQLIASEAEDASIVVAAVGVVVVGVVVVGVVVVGGVVVDVGVVSFSMVVSRYFNLAKSI